MTVFGRDCNTHPPLHSSSSFHPTPTHQEARNPICHTTTPPAHARHPPLPIQQRTRPLNSTKDLQPGPLPSFAFPPSSILSTKLPLLPPS